MAAPTTTVTLLTGLTTALTVNAGDDYLVVGYEYAQDNAQSMPTVTSMGYDGIALTKYQEKNYADTATGRTARTEVWILAAPTVGTRNLVVTLSDASTAFRGVAHVLAGANASGPNAFTLASGASNSFSANITTATDNSLILSFGACYFPSATYTVNSPATEAQNTTGQVGILQVRALSSYYAKVTAGVQSMGWTYVSGTASRESMILIAVPSSGGGGGGGGGTQVPPISRGVFL